MHLKSIIKTLFSNVTFDSFDAVSVALRTIKLSSAQEDVVQNLHIFCKQKMSRLPEESVIRGESLRPYGTRVIENVLVGQHQAMAMRCVYGFERFSLKRETVSINSAGTG